MPSRDQPLRPPAAPLRALAGLLAFFVLALACAVQSPAAHAWLHGDAHGDHTAHAAPDDAGCPVTLFAQGLTLPLVAPMPGGPLLLAGALLPVLPGASAPSSPDRLHPPAHAPPACGWVV